MSEKAIMKCVGAVLAVALTAIGLVGLSNNVDYSGWVLFVALLWVVNL